VTQESFNAVDWMMERHPSLHRSGREQFEHVLHFALMWNMFESSVCNQSASLQALEAAVDELERNNLLGDIEFNSFLSYFQNRYVSNREFTERFPHLRLRSRDREQLVREVLLGNETNPSSVALTCLLIVYRYRNNLFHGIKEIYDIGNQKDLFEQSSMLLAKIMEAKGV